MSQHRSDERSALLSNRHGSQEEDEDDQVETVRFGEEDSDNPQQWSLAWKYNQVVMVFLVGLTLPVCHRWIILQLSQCSDELER